MRSHRDGAKRRPASFRLVPPFSSILAAAAPALMGCAGAGFGPEPSTPPVGTDHVTAVEPLEDEPKPAHVAPPAAPLPPGAVTTLVSFPSPRGELHGYLTRPAGPGPFPTFVWNHGSEKLPGKVDANASFFASQGFVFFVPHRLGHGRSPGAYIVDEIGKYPKAEQRTATVRLLDGQADDVAAAVAYIRAQPFVDANRVYMGGCSYGGIQTILGAERGLGLRGAVDFAGAAMSWSNTELQARLVAAVRRAPIPVFFVQAENDFTTQPSRVLYDEMTRANKPAFIKIYPSTGGESMDGHLFCVRGSASWGPDVLKFLQWASR